MAINLLWLLVGFAAGGGCTLAIVIFVLKPPPKPPTRSQRAIQENEYLRGDEASMRAHRNNVMRLVRI